MNTEKTNSSTSVHDVVLRRHTSGVVVEQGVIGGQSYRVWQRKSDGKKFVYVGDDSKRHNIGWLKKRKERQ